MIKKLSYSVAVVVVLLLGYDGWNMHINNNFGTISPNKVYKSRAIDADDIGSYIDKYNIKTVIDLRDTQNQKTNREAEKKAIDAIDGTRYINIKSPQTPTKENLKEFYEVMDDKSNYPVLIHCYHGLGRTMLYSALYRIEYENMSNKDARWLTRPYPIESILHNSSFAKGRNKGDFLINYIKRDKGDSATIKTME
ncbi:MAG: protein phosphatase [Epsilonproteobacteria bacterium]|nr:MAG: protein phosphatase [Campylobacterota bacterium]